MAKVRVLIDGQGDLLLLRAFLEKMGLSYGVENEEELLEDSIQRDWKILRPGE
jgi:hypothetical protein